MDKYVSCYFNLVRLIEKFGYSAIDYIYYKKGDGDKGFASSTKYRMMKMSIGWSVSKNM